MKRQKASRNPICRYRLPCFIAMLVTTLLGLQLSLLSRFHGSGIWTRQKYHLNLVPLEERFGILESHAHCIGDNYKEDNWKHKSCHYRNLCLNRTDNTFVVFRSEHERVLEKNFLGKNKFMHSSTLLNQSVSIGGLNQKWTNDGMKRLKWTPRIVDTSTQVPRQYYLMKTPLILYHSLNGANPGHLVWDDFLPIYTLLKLFLTTDESFLPMRYVLNDGERALWASCDFREDKRLLCDQMTKKFLPLLVGLHYPYRFTASNDWVTDVPNPDALVCAENALVGMGDLTDHGSFKSHGWERRDFDTFHNHGRALYDFRNFMLANMEIPIVPNIQKKVVVSKSSSNIPQRNINFRKQINFLREHKVNVHPVVMKEMSTREQVLVVHDAKLYITLCGGGAVNAMWLPRGASAILYYAETSGVEHNKYTGEPAMLDWDLMNSLSYIRVHWLPLGSLDSDMDTLALLLNAELTLEP